MGIDPFVADVAIYAFRFAPVNWASCYGAPISQSQNTALYSLIGTTYGGSGANFNLPDLKLRTPIGFDSGGSNGLTSFALGATGGANNIKLDVWNLPEHSHVAGFVSTSKGLPARFEMVDRSATESIPEDWTLLASPSATSGGPTTLGFGVSSSEEDEVELGGVSGGVTSGSVTIGSSGDGEEFQNYDPLLTVNFCIALDGIYPSRD